MDEKEVKEKFMLGMEMFKNGISQPIDREQRIESLGWRHAKKTANDLELTLETVIEAYCEKGYQDKIQNEN